MATTLLGTGFPYMVRSTGPLMPYRLYTIQSRKGNTSPQRKSQTIFFSDTYSYTGHQVGTGMEVSGSPYAPLQLGLLALLPALKRACVPLARGKLNRE